MFPKSEISFSQLDMTDAEKLHSLFSTHRFDGVIHCAGYKSIEESRLYPVRYYRNNLLSTINLLEVSSCYSVSKFVFSSSATVYGDAKPPLIETLPIQKATNPYGHTKAMCEQIMQDAHFANPELDIVTLRYFNPVGGHTSGRLKDSIDAPNLMPALVRTAQRVQQALTLYGTDFPTQDGTCIRDFIHVMDLADGHVAAFEKSPAGYSCFNLGTGQGTSVKELVATFEKVHGMVIPLVYRERREGDSVSSYADVSLAYEKLGWRANRTLEDMCRDAL